MATVLVEITDAKAYKYLKDLESIHILKVLKKYNSTVQKLSEKYANVFIKDDSNSFDEHTNRIRQEWDNITLIIRIY